MMVQETRSPESQLSDTPGEQNAEGTPHPKKKSRRWIACGIGGCLSIFLCLGAGVGILLFSGVLSGTHGNSDEWPEWSPDGTRILFASDRDGNFDIYVMNVDGSNIRQLTRDPFAALYIIRSPADGTPTWSPDGRQIAFGSGRSNNMTTIVDTDIYVMNADGSHVVKLIDNFDADGYPAWSPDGKKIAFITGRFYGESPPTYIMVVDADGSHETQLTDNTTNTFGLAWSPDSSQISYVSGHRGTLDLYTMNADGSGVIHLPTSKTYLEAPVLSPDGSRIAFVAYIFNSNNRAIYAINADGSDIVQLTDDLDDAYHPSWSPDGSRIAFVISHNGDSDIYIMNADGSNQVNLTGE